MKKLVYLTLLAVLTLSFASCKDDDDNEWRDTNEAAFSEIAANPDYSPVTIPGGPSTVYHKVIQSGTGTENPLQTSKVKVYYKGTYYNGSVFDYGTSITDVPAEFALDGVARGFSVALQKMVVGDKWEIWIPWYLGYGSSAYQSIPAYSTLVFEVELLSITQYPSEK